MNIKQILSTSERFINNNSPHILTGIGCVGLVSTAVFTGQATLRAVKIIEKRWQQPIERMEVDREDLKMVWKCYIPPIVTGSLSIAAIIGANRIGTRRAAALATAYTISDRAFHEYKEKVIEKIGESQERQIRDEVYQDRAETAGPAMIVSTGKVPCLDSLSGRQFESTVEDIRAAQNDINQRIMHDMYASLSEFYNLIGLPTTAYSTEVGWNIDQKLEIDFSTVLSQDKIPCVSIDYRYMPNPHYMKF